VSELIAYFRRAGRLQLADDLRRHLNNRVIFESARLKVRETASEYVTESSMATNTIANFALQFTHNLLFRDNVDLLHQAKLIFGRGTYSVALTAQALENPDRLQEAVRAQVMSSREARTQDTLPTVIDKANFKKYLVPHFKRQVANLKPLEGVNNLGWTIDRLMFAGPGLKVTMSGRSLVQVPFHPSAPSLRYMRPSVEWSDVFPENLSRPSADLVAMILASCVRYYVKSITRPLCVHHSPASRKLLQSMFRAIGQHDTFELNPNARDNAGVPGVRGFPFLVTGYNAAQAEAARFSHVLLTDTGYSVPEELLPEEAEAAGRALQSGLLRVAEWCLATGAEDFTESSSLHYNTSLLREGRWVMENVCDRQPWEVSDLGLAHLEGLLAQIPVAETAQRLTLHEGRLLTMDTRGLVWDPERVGADLKTISTDYRIDGDKLEMNAVGILPGLSMFYGREPEIASTF
jgi:hypothetical protein